MASSSSKSSGRRLLAVVFAACLPVVVIAAFPPVAVIAQQSGIVVAARDEITITIYNQPSLSGKFLVDVDGTFLYPEIGRIQATGLTPRALEIEITRRLSTIMRNPQVTVLHVPAATKKFTVSGQVQSQGTFSFGGDVRLLEALARAGSIRDDAGEELLIIRPRTTVDSAPAADGAVAATPPKEPETIPVDLYALMDGDIRYNIPIHDGDTVLVRKAEPVFITGYVNSVNAYQVRRGMTVEQALALAGGVSAQGAKNRIELTRTINGEKKTFKVQLTDLVRPGDTIKVGRRIV
jgi:polysaccharide biosynthesis/export protein